MKPGGRIEPDPAVLPGALESLHSWSQSMGILVRSVRDLRVNIAVIGGMIANRTLQTPLTILGNSEIEKRKIGEYVQVIQQMVLPRSVSVVPRVVFRGLPLFNATQMAASEISSIIIQQATRLMEETFYFNGSHSIP